MHHHGYLHTISVRFRRNHWRNGLSESIFAKYLRMYFEQYTIFMSGIHDTQRFCLVSKIQVALREYCHVNGGGNGQ